MQQLRGYKWGDGRVEKNCLYCGVAFQARRCELERGGAKFCGVECYHKSRVGTNITEKHKEAISKANKGNVVSLKGRENISKANRGRTAHNKGKKYPIEWRMSISKGKLKGEALREPINKAVRGIEMYKRWRTSVFERDNYTCVKCGSLGELNADHYPVSFASILCLEEIKSTEDALNCERLWDIENGRTLCIPCHKETDTYSRHVKYHTVK